MEEGTWSAIIQPRDQNNQGVNIYTADLAARGFPTQLTVASAGSDTEPPVLVDFDFAPRSVNTTAGPQSVTCTVSLQDEPAGVQSVWCIFRSPTNTHEGSCTAYTPISGDVYKWTFALFRLP